MFNILPQSYLVIGEARHFKYIVLTDTEENEWMHDILLQKGKCSKSRDLFRLWIISDNISVKVKIET